MKFLPFTLFLLAFLWVQGTESYVLRSCPPPTQHGFCAETCDNDLDCPGNWICCRSGCWSSCERPQLSQG
ncbi:hypothetical protein EB796_003258 [Bugula neritina]|uniref:WAP domain-containing protein n=1 Tax=Bugula neritina TaxID=10212 RepID=A0A7J7KIA9_BUGNE|nr:hypothetical protein EB796_003258 [Bugula neritina]